MALFPQSFIDDVRHQADIVLVVQDYVSLKRAGRTYKGLCPFHADKNPSFHVDREKAFFHCFACGAGGDVFTFLERQEGLGFTDAVRQLAQRFGVPIPTLEARDEPDDREREALLKAHEMAAVYFREQLEAPGGAAARQMLRERGVNPDTVQQLTLGLAPATRDGLKRRLMSQGFALPQLLRSGLLSEREGGEVVDRFRGRLMIPIARDTGPIVAFGGRTLDAARQPKYLNSPETPIYSKSRVLYGLNLSKSAIRKVGFAVLVEGYFDFAQLVQAGIANVVASCGTALTPQQAALLRRFTSKVVLSYDPDAAGQGAAERSSELLVAEGFDVNVAVMPQGQDPDSFVRREGGKAYADRLRTSLPYLEFLLERAAAEHDLTTDEHRRQFLSRMLAVAARIPDAAARDQFADRLSHKARITEEVVRAEIRRAAVDRRTTLTPKDVPAFGHVRQAEKGLIWGLFHETAPAMDALRLLEPADLETLASGRILEAAQGLLDFSPEALPSMLLRRLNTMDGQLLAAIAAGPAAPAPARECARTLKRLRYERERAALQREIDRLQSLGAQAHESTIDALWERKKNLVRLMEDLEAREEPEGIPSGSKVRR